MGPTLNLKLVAFTLILLSSAAGVSLPLLLRRHHHSNHFSLLKSFAAGVILATGFVHMLPAAIDALSSLSDLPLSGFAAMLAAIGTLMADAVGTSVYDRENKGKGVEVPFGEDGDRNLHSVGSSSSQSRQIVVSQVLELGIVSHSVIIGLSLGVSQNPSTIKLLIAALSVHQFFEGFALGGCISQACFDKLKETLMACFFAVTTPGGIAIGLATASLYNPESPTAVVVEGILDSVSAGILIYMSLVDLIATDFREHQKTNNVSFQVGCYIALFLGAGLMSLLAIWA